MGRSIRLRLNASRAEAVAYNSMVYAITLFTYLLYNNISKLLTKSHRRVLRDFLQLNAQDYTQSKCLLHPLMQDPKSVKGLCRKDHHPSILIGGRVFRWGAVCSKLQPLFEGTLLSRTSRLYLSSRPRHSRDFFTQLPASAIVSLPQLQPSKMILCFDSHLHNSVRFSWPPERP